MRAGAVPGPILAATLTLAAAFALAAALVAGRVATSGMSYSIYVAVGLPGMAAAIGCPLAVLLALRALPGPALDRLARIDPAALPVPLLALGAGGAAAAGVTLLQGGLDFSLDEWMTRFQAAIFLEGRLAGEVPAEFREIGRALFPLFVAYDAETGAVASGYRPGMAALHAGFETAGLGAYVSAAAMGASVALAAAVARQLWPGRAGPAAVAALLVATSQQALAAATTSYAMSAHLAFNLAWIWLFLRDRPWSHALAALLGVATAALHQVHMHAVFALPFLLSLLGPLRAGVLAWYGGVYLAGHLAVLAWDPVGWAAAGAPAERAGLGGLAEQLARLAALPDAAALATVYANLARFLAWQSLALLPLLILARRAVGRRRALLLLAASVATSLLPYPLLMPDQGHGWGYRYLHGVIGNLALLGAAGWAALGEGERRLKAGLALLLLATPLVMVPLRAGQIRDVLAPYRAAHALTAAEADLLIVDDYRIYYGVDLVRNDPFLRAPPAAIRLSGAAPGRIARLCAGRRTVFLDAEALRPLGLVAVSAEARAAAYPDYPARVAAARACARGRDG